MLLKHVVLIMQIMNITINMDGIRQERPNEGPILKLNNVIKQEIWLTRQEICGL